MKNLKLLKVILRILFQLPEIPFPHNCGLRGQQPVERASASSVSGLPRGHRVPDRTPYPQRISQGNSTVSLNKPNKYKLTEILLKFVFIHYYSTETKR